MAEPMELESSTRISVRARAVMRLLRPLQWTKNLLIAVPLVLAHQLRDTDKLLATFWAIIAFSACASAVYVLNDLLDVNADRTHPSKRRRPFASGEVPAAWGIPLAAALLAIALLIAWLRLPISFCWLLAIYVLVSSSYSLWLKSQPILDVLVLASFYTVRILAGGVAANVEVSEWLMAFSMFLFTSLAFAKRCVELSRTVDEADGDDVLLEQRRRGYRVSDLRMIETMGMTSGYLAVLVLALYVTSDKVTELYESAWALWFICLLMLYWITRVWLLAHRGELHDDPVVFALTDKVSLLIGAGVCGVVILASSGV